MHNDLQAITGASRLATLTTKVAQILDSLSQRQPTGAERAVLERGAELLGKMVSGSLLVSGERTARNGLHPSQSGLHVFGSAVSAARHLNMLADQHPDITEMFIGFREQLLQTAGQGTVPQHQRILVKFFDALSQMFERDIERATFARRRNAITARP